MAQITDSIHLMDPAGDSIALDSAAHDTSYVLVIEPAAYPPFPVRKPDKGSSGLSWILGGLLLLFVIIAIRFRNNSKYLGALLKNAIEVRERGNVFDDTVKESSFMVILNILWSFCAGLLLYVAIVGRPDMPEAPYGMGMGVLLAIGYELFMILSYWVVGTVFSDHLHTKMWIRGYLAATGLTILILFPAALMAICYPLMAATALWIGFIAFIIGKIVFIWKGFRIFFTQIDAWLLFLYYLCSLEIIPIILLYVSMVKICG